MRQLKRIFIKGLLTKKQREPTRDRKALQYNKEDCVNTPRTEGAMEEMVTKPEQSSCQLVSIEEVRVGDGRGFSHWGTFGNVWKHFR